MMETKFKYLPNDVEFEIAIAGNETLWKLALVEIAYQLKRIADRK